MPNISKPFELDEEDTQKDRFLTFLLGTESYGIEIRYVREIVGMQPITQMPDLPEYVRGIINLRGTIIPILDMRRRFKKIEQEYTDRTCVVIVDIRETTVGLVVDTVAEVLSIDGQNIVSPPQVSNCQQRYISGIGKVGNDVKLLLDCEKLLTDDEITDLQGN